MIFSLMSSGDMKYLDASLYVKALNLLYGLIKRCLKRFWYKRKSFEYENEVRAIVKRRNISEKGIYIPINIEKLIDRIYVSPYAPEWFVAVVKSVVDKYKIDVPVLHSQMLEKPFY